jgi:arginine-tRNA-protein transferase
MDEPTAGDYSHFLFATWCDSLCLELQDPECGLVAVAVMDHLPGALSAVYTFYEPSLASRGLGTHMILRQIELARQWRYDWLFLGYWIDGCQRMDYKAEFRPHDIHTPTGWIRRH